MKLGPLQKFWVEQLRKHPKRQSLRGALGCGSSTEYEACCLGELILCSHRMKHKKLPFWNGNIYDANSEYMGVPEHSYKDFGLHDEFGTFESIDNVRIGLTHNNKMYFSLTLANDAGISWPTIADFIENNTETVFFKSV